MPISKLSPIEYRLLKEKVIREYKTKLESQITEHPYEIYIRRFKALIPLNLALGFLASMGYIYLKGWAWFFSLFLSGIIWLTIISAFVSFVVPKK